MRGDRVSVSWPDPADAPGAGRRHGRADVCVLGPVGVCCAERRFVEYPSGVGRAVVAALALGGRTGVNAQRLAAVVWGADGPGTRNSTLPVTIHRTRRWLSGTTGGAVGIRRTAGGYALDLAGGDVDALRFSALVSRARAAGIPARIRLLADALALWRGPALADVPAERTDTVAVAGLERERVIASVQYARALLRVGDPEPAGRVLMPLAQEYPLDEQVLAAWMEVLAATGRQAQALAAYQELRVRLHEELGTDPCRDLDAVLVRVLRGEAASVPAIDREGGWACAAGT